MRRLAAHVGTLVVVLLLVCSIAFGLPEALRAMRDAYEAAAGLSDLQREQAYGAAVPLNMEIFDFYKRQLRQDDRYYMQVLNGPFSTFADKRTVVTKVGNLYLLPALQVQDPRQADVILSFDEDPATLGLRYSEQLRAGQQLIFVSRVQRDE